jgi:stage III sporulation protein AF
MEFIKEWVTNIILFVLFATMIDMLLPNSKFQKYTKMVIGLLLIAIILTPIFKLITMDFEETFAIAMPEWEKAKDQEIKNLIDLQKSEIQESHDAYILKQMAVQLKTDTEEELMDQYGLVITDLNLVADEAEESSFPENLQKVVVVLNEQVNEETAIEAVKPIDINTSQPLEPKTNSEKNDRIIQFLSEKWSVEEDLIEVEIEGGTRDS